MLCSRLHMPATGNLTNEINVLNQFYNILPQHSSMLSQKHDNTLNSSVFITPWVTCCFSSRSTASIAIFVLPAPVGAQINRFSFELYAASKTTDCMRFNFFVPWKAVFPICNTLKSGIRKNCNCLKTITSMTQCIWTTSVCLHHTVYMTFLILVSETPSQWEVQWCTRLHTPV